MTHAADALRRDSLGFANLLLAKALRAPLWLLLSAGLARVLSPEGLGAWSMILAAAMLLNQVFLQWTQAITQRFGRGEWLAEQHLNTTVATRWPLLAGGLTLVVLLLAFTPFAWPQRFYGLDHHHSLYVFPVVLTLWLMAEAQGLQQVRERFVALAWSPLLSDFALLVVVAALALAVQHGAHLGRDSVLAGLYATTLAAWLLWLRQEWRGFTHRWPQPDRAQLQRAAWFALPLVPGFLIGYVAEWGDYFLIRHFYSAHEVGLFHPAYQYLLIMVGLPTALASVLLPKIVAAHDHDNGAAVRALIERHAPQFTALWSMAVLPVAAVLPAVFALLLGAQYTAAVPVLQILLAAVPGAVVLHVYGVACFAQGRLGVSTLGFFGAKSLLNVAVSFYLLPRMGVSGSAFGVVLSYVFLQWLFVWDQRRVLGVASATGAQALVLAQSSGVLLMWVPALPARLALAALMLVVMLLWVRRAALFSDAEVSAIIPARMAWLTPPMQRLLCRVL